MDRPIRVLYLDPEQASRTLPSLDAFDVLRADGPEVALDAIGEVDCVVAVHRPPALDAVAFLEDVRERRPDLPVVVYAPAGDPADGEAAVAAGATDWLPVAPDAEPAATLENRVRNAVDASAHSPAHLEETLERITDAFFALDSDWRFTYVNDRAEQLLDRDESELLGRIVWEAFPGAVGSTFQAEYERAMETQQPVSFEEYFPPLSTWFSVRAYPSETGLSVYFTDVTDRVERERDLQQYETIVETIDDGAYVVDADARFTLVNDALVELSGYDRSELLGAHSSKLVSDDVRALADEMTAEMLAGERTVGVIETELRTADGEVVPIETRISPFPLGDGRDGRVGIVRDVTERRRFERTLTTLHEATRDLVRAESRAAVGEIAVETATEVLDLQGVGAYLYDPDRNLLYPEHYSADADVIHGEVPTLRPGEGLTGRAFVTGETQVVDDAAESDRLAANPTTLRSGLFVPLGDHGVLVAGSTTVGGFDDRTIQLVDLLAATTEAALDRVARESDLREREQELRGQAERLERLAGLTEKLRAVERAIVAEETRAGIEEAVCEALADAERFAFAWIGGIDRGDGTVTPSAWAGEEREYLDAVSIPVDADPAGEPAGRTAATGEPTLVADVSDRLREAPWRGEALSRGLRSVLSVPVAYNEVTYGVLTVYATDPEGFDELAADVFAELAGTVAFAINGAETRRALVADRVVELELAVPDGEGFLAALARRLDCRVAFDGEVASAEGGRHVFFAVRGADRDRVVAAAEAVAGVADVDAVAGEGDDRLYRATVSGPTFAREFASLGAMPRAITAVGDETRVVVELPRTTDVRAFVAAVGSRYPDVELLARRERERRGLTRQGLVSELDGRLTDRQQEALRTAYFSGFFETPRRTTAVELGETLGISQPTFAGHLRAAERKLLELLFGDEQESGLDT